MYLNTRAEEKSYSVRLMFIDYQVYTWYFDGEENGGVNSCNAGADDDYFIAVRRRWDVLLSQEDAMSLLSWEAVPLELVAKVRYPWFFRRQSVVIFVVRIGFLLLHSRIW